MAEAEARFEGLVTHDSCVGFMVSSQELVLVLESLVKTKLMFFRYHMYIYIFSNSFIGFYFHKKQNKKAQTTVHYHSINYNF